VISATDQLAAANAAKELANAQKAAADAQKAQAEAQLAALKATIGEVSDSGLTGAVSAGAGTGDIEATLLAARAVRRAATTIDAKIRAIVPTGRTIAIMAVSEVPSFQNVIAYRSQREIVTLALDNAISMESAEQKGIKGPVAGNADIILVPNLTVGNALMKSIAYIAKKETPSVMMGVPAPIVYTSRTEIMKGKLMTIALANYLFK
jgi:hypothetical protein